MLFEYFIPGPWTLHFLFSRVNYCIIVYFRPRGTKRKFSYLRKGSSTYHNYKT